MGQKTYNNPGKVFPSHAIDAVELGSTTYVRVSLKLPHGARNRETPAPKRAQFSLKLAHEFESEDDSLGSPTITATLRKKATPAQPTPRRPLYGERTPCPSLLPHFPVNAPPEVPRRLTAADSIRDPPRLVGYALPHCCVCCYALFGHSPCPTSRYSCRRCAI
jgi:hypothetical protein